MYGADGFNTATGGYDLEPAATAPTDVGSWVTVESSEVTIPALSEAVVAFTVEVPAGAHTVAMEVRDMKGKLAAWGCLAALGLLLARSAEAAQAVRDGLAMCAGSVIPAAGASRLVTRR